MRWRGSSGGASARLVRPPWTINQLRERRRHLELHGSLIDGHFDADDLLAIVSDEATVLNHLDHDVSRAKPDLDEVSDAVRNRLAHDVYPTNPRRDLLPRGCG